MAKVAAIFNLQNISNCSGSPYHFMLSHAQDYKDGYINQMLSHA